MPSAHPLQQQHQQQHGAALILNTPQLSPQHQQHQHPQQHPFCMWPTPPPVPLRPVERHPAQKRCRPPARKPPRTQHTRGPPWRTRVNPYVCPPCLRALQDPYGATAAPISAYALPAMPALPHMMQQHFYQPPPIAASGASAAHAPGWGFVSPAAAMAPHRAPQTAAAPQRHAIGVRPNIAAIPRATPAASNVIEKDLPPSHQGHVEREKDLPPSHQGHVERERDGEGRTEQQEVAGGHDLAHNQQQHQQSETFDTSSQGKGSPNTSAEADGVSSSANGSSPPPDSPATAPPDVPAPPTPSSSPPTHTTPSTAPGTVLTIDTGSSFECVQELEGGRGGFSLMTGVFRRGDNSHQAVIKYITRDQRREGAERARHLSDALKEEGARLGEVNVAMEKEGASVRQRRRNNLNAPRPTGTTSIAPKLLAVVEDLDALRPIVTTGGEIAWDWDMCVTLFDFGRNCEQVKPLLKLTIAVNLVEAVLALHKADICHDDLHGDNVVLLDETTGEIAIIDYESSRNMTATHQRPLTTRPGPPCTSLHNLVAILEGRAFKDEAITFDSDLISVACSLLLLAFDSCHLVPDIQREARRQMRELVSKCEEAARDEREVSRQQLADEYVAAVERVHMKATTETIKMDECLTPTSRPLSQRTIDLYRDVCVGHATGKSADELRGLMADYRSDMISGLKRATKNGDAPSRKPPKPRGGEATIRMDGSSLNFSFYQG
ncbi:unnamed protein product [Vitrella brassicaformis CCMP3155]|uniref:Protein kinase domain-containing protein n=1 Tax=Vitrella brassicaformis (strain CCMP3155) TaxID=1169540 RepID=A0A0G4EWY0_VITBC|nr:unnamed protein product [Vitrella brassicaformis CCMP3155]|eukprot:CEM02824.1 unnamed protein product [Vitrella brassicaformis CCMP3155]